MSLLLSLTATGGATYTLAADSGSYSLTGQNTTLLYNRVVVADSGSYALSGQATDLRYNRRMVADSGSYSLSGQSVEVLFNRVLAANSSSYLLSGQDVALTYNAGATYTLTADSATYNLTGQPANFVYTPLSSGRSKRYNPNLIDHPAWAHNNKKPEIVEVATEIVESVPREAIEKEIDLVDKDYLAALEDQLAALNINVDKLKSYESLFIAEEDEREALRLEAERQSEEDEEMALMLCIAEWL